MGKYFVRQNENGYRFELMAPNREIILTGSVYASRNACLKALDGVRRTVSLARLEDQTVKNVEEQPNPRFVLYKDKKRRYCYRLHARNGKIVAEGGGFTSKELGLQGIESVRRNAVKSKVSES